MIRRSPVLDRNARAAKGQAFLVPASNLHINQQLGTHNVLLTCRFDVVHGSTFAIAHGAHQVGSRARVFFETQII
jgi:hypothetical protein